jgi:hypothetical protein
MLATHPRRRLKSRHLQFLLAEDNLKVWAHRPLSERCVLFHRQFPEVRISRVPLAKLYQRHGITLKRINFVKK